MPSCHSQQPMPRRSDIFTPFQTVTELHSVAIRNIAGTHTCLSQGVTFTGMVTAFPLRRSLR